jgi:4a-hydroxytetrahydrobiopterin dehydratase
MWEETTSSLRQEFNFGNFTEAFAFMTRVAFEAEKQNHHPNWSNVYNKVIIELSTHDAGNVVTDKDKQLAQRIDDIYKQTMK